MQGIQTLGPGVAEKMAAMGQFEDDQIAHVAEGEVIVPAPILKYYPEVKEQVFAAIRDQGLEPEQFMVGSEMVAINPNTGVQEFGFFKKVFKKIKKIVKKAAPLLLAAALPGVGTFLAAKGGMLGMLGKGIGTLTAGKVGLLGTSAALDAAFKGGNLRDVLKAGATGAAVGGITQGISNQITNQSGGYFTPATPAPIPSTASTAGAADTAAPTTSTAGTAGTAAPTTSTAADPVTTSAPVTRQQGITGVEARVQPASIDATQTLSPATNPNIVYDELGRATNTQPFTLADAQKIMDTAPTASTAASTAATTPTDYSTLSLSNSSTSSLPDITSSATEGLGSLDLSSFAEGETAKTGFFEGIKNEFVENPIPATAQALSIGSTLYGLAGAADYAGEDQVQEDMTVSREDLTKMMGGEEFLNYQGTSLAGLYYNPETQQYQDVPYVQSSGIMAAAAGGHIMGPGTGTSDSIPAYLSDGEFVMTADAVKGAGNGSRKKGAAKMYAMMNRFEGQA